MQHKYVTRAIVLNRTPTKEAGATITLLTEDLGLIRARAEGLRRSGAKLAHALQTLSEVEATLLRGKETWRLSGAVLVESWFGKLSPSARLRAGRRASLMLRLVQGEGNDAPLYAVYKEFLETLLSEDESMHDSAELVATLKSLSLLGHDAGAIPSLNEAQALSKEERRAIIGRINKSLASTGL
jgi:recombinational DNA repair protein (RecF pathway)